GSPRSRRSTNSVFRCTLHRSGSSIASGTIGSLPEDVDFRRLSAMPDLLGCRHRSHCENGVQGIRVRFMPTFGTLLYMLSSTGMEDCCSRDAQHILPRGKWGLPGGFLDRDETLTQGESSLRKLVGPAVS